MGRSISNNNDCLSCQWTSTRCNRRWNDWPWSLHRFSRSWWPFCCSTYISKDCDTHRRNCFHLFRFFRVFHPSGILKHIVFFVLFVVIRKFV